MTPLDCVRRGWRIVPIPRGEKRPTMPGWPDFEVKPEDVPRLFGNGGNVAVLLGPRSGDLVDIDLDCPEALALADLYLPRTGAEFGRKSKPRSHRLFIAPGAVFEALADPISGEMLLELRADGRDGGAHLTLLPPSLTDSERREWSNDDVVAPATADARALRLVIVRLAIGCLVMRYVSEHAARRPRPDLPRVLREFDHELGRAAYRWLGLPDPDAPQRYPRRRRELSRRDLNLEEICAAIPNNCSWEEWNKIGLAIYAASSGSEEGRIAFDDFSSRCPAKYDPHAVEERWRNYRRSPPSQIGLGTLVHHARQAGWKPNRSAVS